MNQKLISWSDYLYIGMAFAVMLSARGEYQDGFYQLILVAVFFVITGAMGNARLLGEFARKFPVFAVLTGVWTVYFAVVNRGERVSYRYAVTAFFVVFAGYAVSASGKEALEKAFEKLWAVLFAFMSVGIVNYIIVHDFGWRMNMFFTHHLPESYGAVVLALVSMLYVHDIRKKIAGIILAYTVSVATLTRFETAILFLATIIYVLIKRAEIAKYLREKKRSIDKKHKMIGGAILVALLGILLVWAGKRDTSAIGKLMEMYKDSVSSLNRDIYLNYYGEGSIRSRIGAADIVLDVIRSGSGIEKIAGDGILSGYYKIKPQAMVLLRARDDSAGPAENTFLSFFSDFGGFAFILYFGIFVSAISSFFRSKCRDVKTSSFLLMVLMLLSAHSDMEYWMNMIFPIFVIIGVYLCELNKADGTNALITSALFSCIIACILLVLDKAHSWIRTTMNSGIIQVGTFVTAVLFFLFIVMLLAFLWCLSVIIVEMLQKKNTEKNRVIVVAVSAAILLVLLLFGGIQNSIVSKEVSDRINEERHVINAIKEGADGVIYNDTFPAMYNSEFGDIKGTLFSGASLAAKEDVTVITPRDEEAQTLLKMGFLYLPISEWDAIYTNDNGTVAALQNMGYNPTGYYTESKDIDLSVLADENGLNMSDEGAIEINGIEEAIKAGPDVDIYPGKKTATYKLKIKSGKQDPDYQICTLTIKQKDVEKEAASAAITRSMCDEKGELSFDLPFNGDGANYDFLVKMDADEIMEIGGISYKATPDIDVHFVTDYEGKVVHEEYFDLEGKPIEIAEGYHGVDYEYNEAEDRVRTRYLGMDLEPVVVGGYAEIRKEYNQYHVVTREEYYGDDLLPIALSGGQAAVDYEYDEGGNRTVDRYYDIAHKPTLFSGLYWYVCRVFDDNNHNILEEYFDKENNLTIMNDGSAGYRREYDSRGDVTKIIYIGTDGKPTINAWGYAIMLSVYDEERRVVREEYHDTEDKPINLFDGQAAVEYEYDNAGNCIENRYYDMNNNPVLYSEKYWCVKRVYNDQQQPILELYYGVDGKPITLYEGEAGLRREYDERGNNVLCTYLGEDEMPIINIWGYSTWRRTYNELKQSILEEYYNVDDTPIEIPGGHAIVEHEYDVNGNCIVDRYYDKSGNPVMYYGEFWYIVREYNDQKQIVHEDFYGLDGNLKLQSKGFCSVDFKYNQEGVLIKKIYYDTSGIIVAEE